MSPGRLFGRGPLAALCLVAAALGPAQESVPVRLAPVAGAVQMLEGRGGNVGVSAGTDGVLLVDDQYPEMSEPIRAALQEAGLGELRFVLNTHWHRDHTGGNATFGAEVPVIAQHNVRTRLARGLAERDIPPQSGAALPEITFAEELSLHFNGEEVRLRHFPAAHTDGDVVVHFTASKVAHLGDLFFNGRFPFIDRASGGSVRGFLAAVETLAEELPPDVALIPGHGPAGDHGDLLAYRQMLRDSVALVEEGLAAGRSLEEIQAQGLAPEHARFAWEFIQEERWLGLLYEGLQ